MEGIRYTIHKVRITKSLVLRGFYGLGHLKVSVRLQSSLFCVAVFRI